MRILRKIVLSLLVGGVLPVMAQTFQSTSSVSSSWGQSSFVSDYYHGEKNVFQLDDNVFEEDKSSFVQNFRSTAAMQTAPSESVYGMLYTAAESIEPGSTTAEYEYSERVKRGFVVPGVPTVAPIGDGWDVLLMLLLLVGGYALFVKRSWQKGKRFAETEKK